MNIILFIIWIWVGDVRYKVMIDFIDSMINDMNSFLGLQND